MIQTAQEKRAVGDLVREWRQRRHFSQLDLACDAEISTRHLSFIETGRSVPSREMVLRLSERLEIPLRARNVLLVAAGHAPVFPERPLVDPALQAARRAVDLVLAGHEPCPALAIDRHWTMIAANRAVARCWRALMPRSRSHRSTFSESPFTRAAWRRARSTTRSGGPISSHAFVVRPKSRRMPFLRIS